MIPTEKGKMNNLKEINPSRSHAFRSLPDRGLDNGARGLD
jgi:hypothetical protein